MKVKDIYYSDAIVVGDDCLAHHGIKGQRWGVRRYQNEDGTYTSAGKKRRTLKQIQHDNREKAISRIMSKKHVDRKTAEKIHKRNRAITAAQILASTMLTGWTIGSTVKEHREAKNIREANRAINKLRMEDLKREADRVANSLRHSDLYYGNYYLARHGIKGQRWGVRRYQNEDGTYTNAGKKRYALSDAMNRKLMAYDTKQNINRISKSAQRKAESLIKDKKNQFKKSHRRCE